MCPARCAAFRSFRERERAVRFSKTAGPARPRLDRGVLARRGRVEDVAVVRVERLAVRHVPELTQPGLGVRPEVHHTCEESMEANRSPMALSTNRRHG